ncbi:MAG TPA: peptidoglycan-binding domain-containing protein, partial [Symbiobacteriaceae bacterium]|nr:peptidoglycan-binding domain-containing protein [Symbiobacteriaceae bacterium]
VLYLQYRLQDLGYDVETRGHFGRKTTEAVRLFAEANGLGNEPAVTEKVVEALNAKVAALHKQVQQEDLQLAKAVEVLKGLMKP